ncbi:hypothetical protein [Novosphingobium sp. AP12]|uniref:hypothetical protein n=1 Tax=Novosphingobium sp. AP12 TaxID=1144305 RepID=UPI000271DDF6|nr:hypothetical protein [Novosphingobium sp. AP12]EJL21888.1 hypothetical protein PMI02_04873 [Novosphingobium sp. AP12]
MTAVVFFDPATGVISECATGPIEWAQVDGRPFVEVTEFRPDWDATHIVVDGHVTRKPKD